DECAADERATNADERETNADESGEVLAVHFGRAASCSSVGSVVDVLFLSTVAGAAVLSSLAVLLARRDGTNEGDDPTKSREDRTNEGDSAARDDDGETNETGAPRATKPKEGAPR
ncbi:MAG: hypothetical protein H6720_26265, partial [Sandaracinus sp.]|nr:hypothetical protein [Sandaracinus sp.]